MAEPLKDLPRERESQGARAARELAGRFDRQTRFAPFGGAGQERLAAARATLVGCGALGGVLAQTLFRAGIGELVLVDRDVVEPTNLPRQVLFDERHALERTPKALAAKESLERSGGPTRVHAHVAQLDARNVAELAGDADLVLDGTDNLETRYLLNDFCVQRRLPWIYAGVVGASGLVLPILPGRTACLRCLFPTPPPRDSLPTCETAGVLLPAVGAIASLAAGAALRLLGRPDERERFEPALTEVDAWSGTARSLRAPRDPACPACARGEFPFLVGRPEPVVLCGRNAVQVPAAGARLDLGALRLPPEARDVVRTKFLVRLALEDVSLTRFADGRALIEGTQDRARALALYARVLPDAALGAGAER